MQDAHITKPVDTEVMKATRKKQTFVIAPTRFNMDQGSLKFPFSVGSPYVLDVTSV
jgi:hypothetical protein